MSKKLKPVQVSPLIKASRWTLLVCGIVYGATRLESLKVYDMSLRPEREQKIKEKYERIYRESKEISTRELKDAAQQFEVTEFPEGWNDDL